jgi:hypothetical protein
MRFNAGNPGKVFYRQHNRRIAKAIAALGLFLTVRVVTPPKGTFCTPHYMASFLACFAA